MKALANILSQQIIQKLGWTLLHFIWQAVAVALLLAILLRVLRKSTANVRYIIACLALGLIVLLPVVTLHLVPISASYPTASVEPAPVPSVLPMEEAKQVPVAEMPVLEGPVQLESVAITPKVSWRRRAVDVLEPALPYIVSAWFVGVFGLSLWHLGGWTQMQRLRRRMVKQIGPLWQSKLKELARLLGIRRAVQLAESALVRVPTVVGWLRPVILLPASALTGLSPQQLEAMLAHELAHIKRFDYLVNILQTVVEILGFYHPAVWWVSHRIRAERENCCDDLAVSISGDRLRYAKALTSMEEIRNARPNLAVAATGGSLFKRISRLLGKDSQPNSRSSWIPSVIAILLIAALAIPTTLALTDSRKQKTDVLVEVEGSPDDGGDEDQPPKPITRAYEKARASENLKIKVGPTTFEVDTVVRWDGEGTAHFEDGLGEILTKVVYTGPGYSKQAPWMDIANIRISPDWKRYDVLELRVFDHQTREMLSPKGRIGVGYDISRSVVQLRSIGAPLPKSVDVWFRLLHNPSDGKVWIVNAKSFGKPVQLYREQISLRTIKDGLWSHSTKQPVGGKPGQIQWTKRHEDSEECMAVFDFTNVKRSWLGKGEKYQICAVGVDGKRYVPDFPHFIGVVSGATEIIRFDIPAEKVRRFEIRPFHGRDRFYFDNVKLPKIAERTFDPPPIVTARVSGKKTEYTPTGLDPISLNVRVLPGIAAASVQGGSGTLPARVFPISEPHGNLDTQTTAIYDFHGIELNRCFLTYLDDQGAPVTSRSTSIIALGAPARQFAGYERVEIPIEKIDQIRLSLVENDPRLTEIIRPAEKRVPTELTGRVVDRQGKPIADVQVEGEPLKKSSESDELASVKTPEASAETAKQDISGFVTDENGVPIVGAVASIMNNDLVLSAKREKFGEREHFVISGEAHGLTGSDGRFKLACLKPGRTDISIQMKGYRTEFLRDVPTGTRNLKVALGEPSPYALSGKVIDAEGNPVSGVEITLSEDSFTRVQTDDDGEFRFDMVLEPVQTPNVRRLFARKKGFGVWGKLLDTSGGETFVKITLLPETAVSGRVTDKAGEPIANAKVGLWSCFGKDTDFSYNAQHHEIAPKVKTGADGQFILKGMPQESIVLLYVEADRYAHGRAEGIKTGTFNGYARQIQRSGAMGTMIRGVRHEAGEIIEVKLQRAATLRGVVVYEDTNQPAARVKVRTHSENNWAKATTAIDGRFEIIGVSPESCRIIVVHKGSREGSLSEWTAPAIEINGFDPGEIKDDLKMVLTKGGVIRGTAVDAKGNTLEGILIAFYSTAGPRSKGTSWIHHTHTLADGSWSYRFPPGQVHAFVNTNDLGTWSKSEYTLDLKKGQVIDNIDFRLNQEVPENSPYRKMLANKPDVQGEVEKSWGEAVEGVQIRLRAEKVLWVAGDTLKFKVDVRNDGWHRLLLAAAPDYWEVEVDGVWYRATIPLLGDVKRYSFGPDKQWYNLPLWLDLRFGWLSKDGTLELRPGRHTVRAALARGLSEDGKVVSLRAVSNLVEIEILPPEEKTDVQVDAKSAESTEKLRKLNTAILMYANDYDDKYPDNIQALRSFLDAEDLNWLITHVEYLGKGKTSDDLPTIPLAYDRTPAAEKPTNVLFNNNRVEFVTPERLKEFGISKAEIQIEVRLVTASEGPA